MELLCRNAIVYNNSCGKGVYRVRSALTNADREKFIEWLVAVKPKLEHLSIEMHQKITNEVYIWNNDNPNKTINIFLPAKGFVTRPAQTS